MYSTFGAGLRGVAVVLVTAVAGMISGPAGAQALPYLPAGDSRLRAEVELNADEDRVPFTTTWPLSSRDLPDDATEVARSSQQPGSAADAGWFLNGAAKPTALRVFDDTPRSEGEAGVQAGWAAGDYAGGVVRLSYSVKPKDQMNWVADDSYASWRFGNWWVTVGAQQRWWGPGWDGSLILGNNARPMPGIALDRARATAPETRWLRWIGPWRLTTMMNHMENHRADFNNTLFWGARLSIQPASGLEVSLSRVAIWCGKTRPCGLHTFWDVLTARKNALVNASGPNPANYTKPAGNEAALDARWHLGSSPFAIYWQENGASFDTGNYRPRQTSQLFGLEWGGRELSNGRYRGFLEFADTACGGISASGSDKATYGCAYENSVYPAGFRYRGRAIGDAMDRDGRRTTLGNLWIDDDDRSWELRLRRLELNRGGIAKYALLEHTVTPVRENVWEATLQVEGKAGGYTYTVGAGLDRVKEQREPSLWKQGYNPSAFLSLSHPW